MQPIEGGGTNYDENESVSGTSSRWSFGRIARWTLLSLVVLFAGGYALLAFRFYAHGVQVKKNYSAELNEPILKLPEEKRAWTHYRRAMMQLEPLSSIVDKDEIVATSPDDEKWSETVEYLKRNGGGLALVRRAAAIRPLGELHRDQYDPADVPWLVRHGALTAAEARALPAAGENPRLLDLVRASSQCSMKLARLLAADAKEAALARDSTRVVADILAIFDMYQQWSEETLLMDQAVGSTMLSVGLGQCGSILADHSKLLSDEQLSRIARRLAEMARRGPERFRFDGEKMLFADIVQRSFTDDGQGDGQFCVEALSEFEPPGSLTNRDIRAVSWSAPIAARFFAGRREVTEKYEQYLLNVETSATAPLWRRNSASDDSGIGEIEQNGARYLLLAIAAPAVQAFSINAEHTTQRRDAALAAIAMVRFEQRHGRWPNSLEELRPDLLTELPVDRFDGNLLRYRLIDGRPLLYSVGTNLKDDGGTTPSELTGFYNVSEWPPDATVDGDWVLWPPVKEPKAAVQDDGAVNAPRPPEPEDDEDL
jgi:hypothetical protein